MKTGHNNHLLALSEGRLPRHSFWQGRRVLVTGHTGFKGSWLVTWLCHMGANVTGLALLPERPDSLFEAAQVGRLCRSCVVDVRDQKHMVEAVESSDAEIVIHLAAQSLVRRSYRDPTETIDVNVRGTVNLLDAIRLSQRPPKAVLVATTDKVYFNDGSGLAFAEDARLGGYDPYAASKTCAEIIVNAYRRSFLADVGIVIATARGGNVIGGGDVSEDRLVPDICRAISSGRKLQLRSPDSVRPWQHVLDCLCAYICYVEDMASGVAVPATLNVGPDPDATLTVREVVDAIYAEFGSPGGWQEVEDSQMPEARLLRLDATAARRSLGWRERVPGRIGLAWTARWYARFMAGSAANDLILGDLRQFEAGSP